MLHLSVHMILKLSWVPWSLSPWELPALPAEAHLRRDREIERSLWGGRRPPSPPHLVALKRWGNPFSFTRSNQERIFLRSTGQICGLGGPASSFWSTMGPQDKWPSTGFSFLIWKVVEGWTWSPLLSFPLTCSPLFSVYTHSFTQLSSSSFMALYIHVDLHCPIRQPLATHGYWVLEMG